MNYEFKGTKEKWMVEENTLYALYEKDNIAINKFYAGFYPDWNNEEAISELKYNIKLASKAPELFEFIKRHYRYLNLDDQKEAEQLLKESTEL